MPLLRRQLQGVANIDLVFVDDAPEFELLNGHRVMTYPLWLQEPCSERYVSIAIANSTARENIALRCKSDGVKFIDIHSDNVIQHDAVSLGEGSILCPFVTLTSNIQIGKQFHANIYSYVAHDCVIGDFVTFAPGVKCNGNVVIEDHVYIGTGAVLKQGTPNKPLVIGRGSVIGMGSIVTKNVPAGVTVVGNPARILMKS